jgi:quercetin dioxygenase-like cupin family protein
MHDLSAKSAYELKTPYAFWQETEGIPGYDGYWIEDVRIVELGDWPRTGGKGAFVNLNGAGMNCDAHINEIPPKQQLNAERHLYEEIVFILSGQGATVIWNDGGAKHTLEWQEGSLFSPPLNTWHQHFNADSSRPARFISLTSAPQAINQYRNQDFIFNNPFIFSDRYRGEAGELTKPGQYIQKGVKPGRVWETNFVANLMEFQPKEHSARGAGTRNSLFEFVGNTMSAHLSAFPPGKYKKAHRHGPGAHIVILTGNGYSLMWPEGTEPQRIDWRPGSLVVPPLDWYHQHFCPGPEPARFIALKPWGFKYLVEDLAKSDKDENEGGTQIEYGNQDPKIHRMFVEECSRRGAQAQMPMFA